MDNKKDDQYYIEKVLNDIKLLQKYSEGKTVDDLNNDIEYTDAVMFRLVQMIENIKNISDETKDKYPNIKWGKIIGFRNGIVHEYGETDYSIVQDILTKELIILKDTLLEELCPLKQEEKKANLS